ncbi:hypothetical protein MMN78_27100 [Escherichia coli]|nr:hypothetical protein [Escherichia coli]MCM4540729.1 hypothetical protein [Escherichia coli]
MSKLALENGINANLLFKWRQQWREGEPPRFSWRVFYL